jgi:hypothetical protein
MSRKRSKKDTKPVVVHVIEVFSDESNEPGWLYYSPKTPEAVAKRFAEISGSVGENEFEPIGHEPDVKAWFIAEPSSLMSEKVEGYADKFEEVLDAQYPGSGEAPGWVYCAECATKEPCKVWNLKTVMAYGYAIVEDDPWMDMLRTFNDFLNGVLKEPSGMSVKSAAKTLGVEWPVTKEGLEQAFKKAAMKAHPDLGGSDAAMKALLMAREVLMRSQGSV